MPTLVLRELQGQVVEQERQREEGHQLQRQVGEQLRLEEPQLEGELPEEDWMQLGEELPERLQEKDHRSAH